MEDQERLDILRQGVEVWNRWREKNPDIEVGFSDTSLGIDNLCYVNFQDAFLLNVTFCGSNLYGANLYDAKLCGSDFSSQLEIDEDTQTRLEIIDGLETEVLDYDVISTCLEKADLSHSDCSQTFF